MYVGSTRTVGTLCLRQTAQQSLVLELVRLKAPSPTIINRPPSMGYRCEYTYTRVNISRQMFQHGVRIDEKGVYFILVIL